MVDQLWMWIVGDGKYYCQIETIIGWSWHQILQKSEAIIHLRRLASSEIFYPEKEIGNLTFLFSRTAVDLNTDADLTHHERWVFWSLTLAQILFSRAFLKEFSNPKMTH